MKFRVCESLQSFYKFNESVETSKKIFQEAGIEENDTRWIKFKETFSQDPEYADLFAELISNPETTDADFERILKSYRIYIKPLNILPGDLDKSKFTSFQEYKDMLENVIEKKQEAKTPEEPKEDKNVRQEIPQKEPEKIVKTEITQSTEDENQTNDKKPYANYKKKKENKKEYLMNLERLY